jgi:hypothetical protein
MNPILPSQIQNLITIKRGDTSRVLYDTLYLNDGETVLDLTGSTVLLAWYNTMTKATTKVSASIVSSISGSVMYSLSDGTYTDVTGSYLVEWQVNNTIAGTQLSVPTTKYIKINVMGDLE